MMKLKNLGIFLVLITMLCIPLYVTSIYMNILPGDQYQEGLDTKNQTPTKTEEQKPGVYVMTNTTYDNNGNVVVKTMDTCGNFSVNTYGSTIVNQTATQPPLSNTHQETTQTNNQTQVTSQTKFLPQPSQSQSTSDTQSSQITASDVSQIAAAAAAAAAAATANHSTTITTK